MRDYGKIECGFWPWAKKKKLTEEGKILALYLLSGPHSNSIGCYILPEGYIMADLGWAPETISKAYMELSRNGFAYGCDKTDYIFISDHIEHNPPANPKVGVSMVKIINKIPSDFSYWPELIECLKPYNKRFPDGFINGLSNGIANHEQEQEHKQEQEKGEAPPEEIQEGEKEPEALGDNLTLPHCTNRTGDDLLEKPPTKRKSQLPEDWALPADGLEWAENRAKEKMVSGIDWGFQAERFKNHHHGEGTKKLNWAATWRTWAMQTVKWAAEKQGQSTGTGEEILADVMAGGAT